LNANISPLKRPTIGSDDVSLERGNLCQCGWCENERSRKNEHDKKCSAKQSDKVTSPWKDAQSFPAICSLLYLGLPAEGLEPTRSCDHWILSPARLPIPPRRRFEILNLQARPQSSTTRSVSAYQLFSTPVRLDSYVPAPANCRCLRGMRACMALASARGVDESFFTAKRAFAVSVSKPRQSRTFRASLRPVHISLVLLCGEQKRQNPPHEATGGRRQADFVVTITKPI
jgi:hypothetical protein